MTRGYIEKHGKPLALYSDKASVFRINNKNATGGDGDTQFGRAMHELNIQTICAETSAAKGRVERAHLTLQDRLVKELRLQGISSMEAANAFAEEFMNGLKTVSSVVVLLGNILMYDTTRMDIKSLGLMTYLFPTPLTTSYPSSVISRASFSVLNR